MARDNCKSRHCLPGGERRSCVGHRQMSEGVRGHESGKFPPSRFIEISAGDTGA